MKVCPRCSELHPDDVVTCPKDGATLRPVRDPLIGRTVGGRFRLIQRLGAGGMSSVYLARHVLIDRLMAIKTLRRDLAQDPVQRDRFLREARAVNRINHENIVEISDFGETEDGLVYLVMEYVPGEQLLHAMGAGPFSAARALDIAEQCAQALARAHQMGVIHRDLKPENILLVHRKDRPDFVKILDFGIAKILDAPSLTGSQQIFGTPGYIAPEYIQSTNIDGRSDLYSLGCILYEMVTGALPFHYEYPGDLLVKHVTEPPIPPRSRLDTIHPIVEAFILRSLAKNPDRRFRDAFHFNTELRTVRDALGSDLTALPGDVDAVGRQEMATIEDTTRPFLSDDESAEPIPLVDTIIEPVELPKLRPPTAPLERPVVVLEPDEASDPVIEVEVGAPPAIPEPPPVDQVETPKPLERGDPPTPTPLRVHRAGIVGARRWRKRFDAIRSYLDEIEAREPAPADVAQGMALASRILDGLEEAAQQTKRHQVAVEELYARAREFRAERGRAMDAYAARLSAEKGAAEHLLRRQRRLRAEESPDAGVRQELTGLEDEIARRQIACAQLEARLGALTRELEEHNEQFEAEQDRLVGILHRDMTRIEQTANALRAPLDLAEDHVRSRWSAGREEPRES